MIDLAYLNARLAGRKTELFSRSALEELITVPDAGMVLDRILESPYGDDLAKALRSYPPLRAVDKALAADLHRCFRFAISLADEATGRTVMALVENWDIQCLKAIFRGLHAHQSPEEILDGTGPGARLESHHVETLVNLPDVRVATEQLLTWSMPWAAPLLPLLGPYRRDSDLRPLESALDVFRFRYLKKGTDEDRIRDPIAEKLLVTEWEAVNVLLCLMFLDQEQDPPLLPVAGRTSQTIRALAAATSMEDAVGALARSQFRSILDEALPFMGEPGRFAILERLMDDELLRQSKREAILDPLSIAVPYHYLRCKQNEVRNLRLIARGAYAHVSPNVIRPGLILGAAAH